MHSVRIPHNCFLRLFVVVLVFALLTACQSGEKSPVVHTEISSAIEQAFYQKVEVSMDRDIVFVVYDMKIDQIIIDETNQYSVIWFAFYDPETEELLASEPGVALARLVAEPASSALSWQILFHQDSDWLPALLDMPEDVMSVAEKEMLIGKTQSIPHAMQTYRGYKLPYPQGRSVKLSGSIAHVYIYKTCPSTCLYAFDFWDGTMFPVSAAKGGVVKKAVWEYPNGNTENTNYLLIEDTSTSPTTYQIYYHLAQDSIPVALRTPGVKVEQGQFIGNADDTGASTAHHLHFMVHTNPSSYWGTSVDIVFDEVAINGGRPRTCKEASLYPEFGTQCQTSDWFVSQNAASIPPTVALTSPINDSVVNTQTITLSAEAKSAASIQSLVFYYRQNSETWQTITQVEAVESAMIDFDVCQWNLAQGSFEVAVSATDSAGKTTDTKVSPAVLHNVYSCVVLPEPSICEPDNSQVALFDQINYSGTCTVVDIGEYASMAQAGTVANETVRSIKVGSEVYAILYANENFTGIQETIKRSDPDLSDNAINIDTVSSAAVYAYPSLPNLPTLPEPFTITDQNFLIINWIGNADDYSAEISLDGEVIRTQEWSSDTRWEVGNLSAGDYTLTVTARNITGSVSNSSPFTVIKQPRSVPQSYLLPLADSTASTLINLQWKVDQGADNIAAFEIQMRQNETEWVTLSNTIDSSQRSYLLIGEVSSTYEFRMRAIAIDGSSEELPMLAETRTTIQTTCTPDAFDAIATRNDTMLTANAVEWYTIQEHNICGDGDEDWLSFNSEQGLPINIRFAPLSAGLLLTAEVIDTNGNILLTNTTGDFIWEASSAGTYYLRMRPQDAKTAGTDTYYQVVFEPDLVPDNLPAICLSILAVLGAVTGVAAKKSPHTIQAIKQKAVSLVKHLR